MSISQAAARVYAKAVFDLAVADGTVLSVGEELHAVLTAIDGLDPSMRAFFEMPLLRPADKVRILDAAFAAKVSRPVLGLLHVLVGKRREQLLRTLVRVYDDLADEHAGRVRASVSSARPMDDELLAALRSAIEERTQRPVVLTVKVDPDLIGGIRVSMGDVVVDGTLRRGLADLRRALSPSQT